MRTFKYSFLLLIMAIFTSCEKDFLEIDPEFKFPDELALNSLEGLDKTTTGAFNALQSGNLLGGGLISNSEFLADNVYTDPVSDFSLNQLRLRSMNPFNGQANGLWNDGYRTINICNIILDSLPQYMEDDPELVELLAAECKFIRGILHFELVRMFAQTYGYTPDGSHPGIPVRTFSGAFNRGTDIPRSTVHEVYEQSISDLEAAEAVLPETKTARVSKWAAQAYLAKIYFQKIPPWQ